MIDYRSSEESLRWNRRRAAWASLVAAAFVAGLAVGLWLGMGIGFRDRQAAAIVDRLEAKAAANRLKLIESCLDGVAFTMFSERGDKNLCWRGSNRMGAKNGD
jgi:hypothetical protein